MITRRAVMPFLVVALAWGAIGTGACWQFATPETQGPAFRWFFIFWALSLADLLTLALAVSAFLRLASDTAGEFRGPLIIQASTWGILKLACLGIFGAILLSQRAIPAPGLLAGTATLVVVPVFGGIWWSQRELPHA